MTLREVSDLFCIEYDVLYRAVKSGSLESVPCTVNGKDTLFVTQEGLDKWFQSKDERTPRPMLTFLTYEEYDRFAQWCAVHDRKCYAMIRDLITKDLKKHGYKLQRYSKEYQRQHFLR